MIRSVTDSTCDLPAELVEQHGITVVPINIQFGSETCEEGVTPSRQEFYRKVEARAGDRGTGGIYPIRKGEPWSTAC